MTEIAESGRRERAVDPDRDYYGALVDTCPDGIFVAQDGKIVFANAALAELLAVANPDDLSGRNISDILYPDDRASVGHIVDTLSNGAQTTSRAEAGMVADDGRTIHVEALARPFTYHGRPAALVVARDISHRIHVEKEREKLIRDLKQARDALYYKATHDSLTSLLNRSAILDRLRTELARSRRVGEPVAVMIADIDHFKKINDRWGHIAGDAVLRSVAERLNTQTRSYDAVGRYGGEEFLAVIPGCDASNSARVAERLCSGFRAGPTRTPEGDFEVTVSFGVAAVENPEDWDFSSILKGADAALYRAKNTGRSRVEHFCSPVWTLATDTDRPASARPDAGGFAFGRTDSAAQAPRKDGLSALNRPFSESLLKRELDRACREGISVTTLAVEIDGLGALIDRRDHGVGDEVLVETARRLQSTMRPYDSLGRRCDGLFIAVLPGCDRTNARAKAERLRDGFRSDPVITPSGSFPIELNVGVVTVFGRPGVDPSAVVRAATDAVRRARNLHDDRVQVGEVDAS